MKSGRIGMCLLLAALGAQQAAAQDLTLTATAGLDGLGRPRRWAPVHVTVDNRGSDLAGALIVEWGTARITHDVALAAPSRREFELYIQSDDPRDVIVVRLESSGRVLTTTEAPVRLASIEERVTACVGSVAAASGIECSVAVPAASLPRSWRGYDAVDRIEVGPGSLDLVGERRAALDLWRRMREVEEAGNAAPASGLVPQASVPADRVRTTLTLYLMAIAAAGIAVRRKTRRGALRYVSIACVAIGGSAAAMATGGSSPITSGMRPCSSSSTRPPARSFIRELSPSFLLTASAHSGPRWRIRGSTAGLAARTPSNSASTLMGTPCCPGDLDLAECRRSHFRRPAASACSRSPGSREPRAS